MGVAKPASGAQHLSAVVEQSGLENYLWAFNLERGRKVKPFSSGKRNDGESVLIF